MDETESFCLERSDMLGFKEELMSTIENYVNKWCDVVKVIGIKGVHWNDWKEVYEEQVSLFFNDLYQDALKNQEKLKLQIEDLLKQSEHLCKTLNISMPPYGIEKKSLLEEHKELVDKVKEYEEILEQRRSRLLELEKQMEKVCNALGKNSKRLLQSPLPDEAKIKAYEAELNSLEKEKLHRSREIRKLAEEISILADELKYVPTLDIERKILSKELNDIELTDENIEYVKNFFANLKEEKSKLETEITTLLERVKTLWDILGKDLCWQQVTLQNFYGYSYEVLKNLQEEIKRCDHIKKNNIKAFILKVRNELKNYWDLCLVSEDERKSWFVNDDMFTEDLLSLHEMELNKWKRFYSENSEIFRLLKKRDYIWQKLETLEKASEAPNRYKNRGGTLLKEEKERKTLNKQLPKLEEKLRDLAITYEQQKGCKFMINGEPLETALDQSIQNRENEKKLKLSARKQLRDLTPTPGKSMASFTPRNQSTNTQTSCKRKIFTPTGACKKSKFLQVSEVLRSAPPAVTSCKVLGGRSRYSLEKDRKKSKISKKSSENSGKVDSTLSSSYEKFEKLIPEKSRSTEVENKIPKIEVTEWKTPRARPKK